jgi:predicted esterase
MDARHVSTPVHGRYLVDARGDAGLLVGFHGYAETAEIHMSELQRIPDLDDWTLVAIQALHPFYRGRSQDVVASWMTRLDRDEAIAHNIEYVKRVIAALPSIRRLALLGFSQGVPMAFRAAARGGFPCSGLIAIGADIPPDVTADESLSLPPILLGRGSHDEWHTAEKLKKDLSFLGSQRVTTCEFEGGHEWTDEFRHAAAKFLQTL